MNKFKSILPIVLIGIMFFILTAPNIASAASPQNTALSLEQAIDIAINKNSTITLIDEKIKNAIDSSKYADQRAEEAKTEASRTISEIIEANKKIKLIPVQKRNIIEVLKLQRIEKVNTLKLDIAKEYFTYLLIQEQLENQEKTIERLKKKFKIIEFQVTRGVADKSVLSDIEVAVKLAEQQYAISSRDLSNIAINMNSLLERPIDSKIELTFKEIPVPKLLIDLEKLTDNKITNSSEILQVHNKETEAKIERDIYGLRLVNERPEDMDEITDKFLNASYDYKNQVLNMECKVFNDNNNLLNLKDDVDIKKLQAGNNEKALKKAKVQYERGLIDIINYNSTIQEFENADIALKKAQLDYFIAVGDFEN